LVLKGIGPSGAGLSQVSGGGGECDRYREGAPPNRAALILP
jgi:hypothetical protein